jgi:uncharacterized Zn finger protein
MSQESVPRRLVKFHELKAGEPRELPIGARRLEACCDCGLVHIHDYAIERRGRYKIVVERVYRDQRGTAQLRRKMAARGDIIKEDGSNAYVLLLRIRANRARKPINVKYEPVPADRRRDPGRKILPRQAPPKGVRRR